MRLIELADSKRIVSWGVQGEHGATTLVVPNVRANVDVTILFQRRDGTPYMHDFYQDDEKIYIPLTNTDTNIVGKCQMSVTWYENNKIIKDSLYGGYITPSALENPLPLDPTTVASLEELNKMLAEVREIAAPQIEFVDELPLPPPEHPNHLWVVGQQHFYAWSDIDQVYYELNSAAWDLICGGTAGG